MNAEIVFSVIIPTYNRADRLGNAIASICAQTEKNWELIIVDDGSTDHTEKVVSQFSNDQIKYYYKKNEERAIARNFGISKAKGSYITFLDSDDELYPHCLKEAVYLIDQRQSPEWFHLAYEVKTENEEIIRKENNRRGEINETLITGNHLSCIGVFVRRDILANYQFNEDPAIIGSEDYILWIRLAARYPLHYSNVISACMHQHQQRSVMNVDLGLLKLRVERSIDIIQGDEHVAGSFGKNQTAFVAHRYLYLALHLAMGGYTSDALSALWWAVRAYPKVIMTRKVLAILKNLIF
ncbi:MAG: glycosyltransferase family 2 protein [Cyclobacteriaceae bacterium]